MSRNISEMAADAFYSGRKFKQSNTRVENSELYLHGNLIARLNGGTLQINLCGWNTQTTRERLNALQGVNLKQINFKPYLNGKEINDSGWYDVK